MAWIHLPAPWPCRLRSRRRSREIPKGSIREATFSCGSGNRSPDYGHSEIDPATRKAVSLRIADHLLTKWWPTRPSEYALFSRLDGQSLQAQCDAFLHSAIECVPEDDINPEGCGSVHDQQDRKKRSGASAALLCRCATVDRNPRPLNSGAWRQEANRQSAWTPAGLNNIEPRRNLLTLDLSRSQRAFRSAPEV